MRHGAVRKRRDANEPAVIAALRAVGATVLQLSITDAPDLLVGFGGGNWLMEVKAPSGKVTDGQQRWHRAWGGKVYLVREPTDALRLIGVL